MCVKQTLVERVHADRDRGWDNGSGVSWTEDIVPLVDAYDAAIAEVERLRSTVVALTEEIVEERAAVVAWLRTTSPTRMWAALLDAADIIERGEHRREGER